MRSAAFAAARNLDRLASVTQRLSIGTTPTNYAGICSLQAHDALLQLAPFGHGAMSDLSRLGDQ
jgi:hypothetical protein